MSVRHGGEKEGGGQKLGKQVLTSFSAGSVIVAFGAFHWWEKQPRSGELLVFLVGWSSRSCRKLPKQNHNYAVSM